MGGESCDRLKMAPHPVVHRTSPKGQPFRGTCKACGKQNIPLDEINEGCSKTMTYEEAVLSAIQGEGI